MPTSKKVIAKNTPTPSVAIIELKQKDKQQDTFLEMLIKKSEIIRSRLTNMSEFINLDDKKGKDGGVQQIILETQLDTILEVIEMYKALKPSK